MDAGLSASLRQAVYDWLDALDRLTDASDTESLAALAGAEMVHLTRAWRELLREHEPTEDGRCRTCAKRRRDRTNRCEVWVSAHRLLIKSDLAAAQGGTAWSATTISSPR
jgi:hypothetical protein